MGIKVRYDTPCSGYIIGWAMEFKRHPEEEQVVIIQVIASEAPVPVGVTFCITDDEPEVRSIEDLLGRTGWSEVK